MSEQAAVDEPQTTSAVTPEPEASPAEKASPSELFRWSAYVHVGIGAEACEDRENGKCGDPTHFHAWCRMPNSLQQNSIREKALAAKARRIRQLRDPGCDIHDILEGDLAIAKRSPATMIDELVAKDSVKEYIEARKDIGEDENYETIDEDRRRLKALDALPVDQRPQDEYDELVRHVGSFDDAVLERAKARQQPVRDSLEQMDTEKLVELLREDRIERDSTAEFDRVFSLWEWYICTLRPAEGPMSQRMFDSVDALEAAAPEVIRALKDAFEDLESAVAGGAAKGN
jgi:hypothetical protein